MHRLRASLYGIYLSEQYAPVSSILRCVRYCLSGKIRGSVAFPKKFEDWFVSKQWCIREHQLAMLQSYEKNQSSLLVAPTGAGKTLAGFLPALADLHSNPKKGLHTLYISPLKALTHDIHRNLSMPIDDMNLSITLESRTGDTPSHKRQRQRKKPPNILLTTPESLMLMLSYADADKIFNQLKLVVIDEIHSLVTNKRGDFTALALSRLSYIAPAHFRFGLSATVANKTSMAEWLGGADTSAKVVSVETRHPPRISVLTVENRMPFGGFLAKYAMKEVYQRIIAANTSLVFVNTRAQAELVFQMLWAENEQALPIALYHGSLSKEQRRKTENMMAQGLLRAIVATSALELGIDWGNVDLVIQIGAPKGVSRLLQRIGRSNHNLDESSKALLVPSNRFEALECQAAIQAVKDRQLDGEELQAGALDIIPQFIMNCACHQPIHSDALYAQVTSSYPYRHLTRDLFDALLQFTIDGGYALDQYDRHHRLTAMDNGSFTPISQRVIRRHRQNIGTIVEAGRLKVKRIRKGNQGRVIGEVEEYFAQQLVPGDTFYFAGEVLQFEAIRDMQLHARPSAAKDPKIPSYVGGQMPLSTFLANGVRTLLNSPERWSSLSPQVTEWLSLQQAFSKIPSTEKVLIEHFPHRKSYFSLFYTFEGRKVNQTLGMLMTKRMVKMKLKPLSFSVTDYGLSICALKPLSNEKVQQLFNPDMLGDELEDWMLSSPMLKRAFRQIAVVSGLTEQKHNSAAKTMKQVTFSTDLIYDTLREHDPDHILLNVTRAEAERELLDLSRLADTLIRFYGKTEFIELPKVSPMAIPIVLDVRSEQVKGATAEAFAEQANLYAEAEAMMDDVRALLN